jgi:hypothetical protein
MKLRNLIFVVALLPQLLFALSDVELSFEVISNDKLFSMLDTSNEEVGRIVKAYEMGDKEKAIEELAAYLKNKMTSSYFFNWRNFKERFIYYSKNYPEKIMDHERRKDEHLSLFPAYTKWKLPLVGLNGEEITPYKIRHLARQHKMIDIGFCYYLEEKNIEYKNYFVEQVQSLSDAYLEKEYETNGNDVFEYFRSGYRVFNWLFTHNLFLASEEYSTKDQILLIKTFLYHGADLYEKTKKFHTGNHHTKGLMALALISILFNEFIDSDKWLNHSINLLTKHLTDEINSDGFQFERSVHYHIGDIDNYFYVYYLAKLNNIDLPESFEQKFKSMFNALIKLALPNNKLPVLQDDTDEPWAEYNSMDSPMYIGALLFQDPKFKYFSKSKPSAGKYWFIRNDDIEVFNKISEELPNTSSCSLDETGYYVMRKGWDKDDAAIVISAGLSAKKPDHQHGDMLGLYAYANNQVILPNYQVRYYLDDYPFFKNSFVKNVAMVDSTEHGQKWKGNKGGSGFGKFKQLPNPKTISWITSDEYDLFVGTHDAYSKIGVEYFRKVIFVKDGFFIVKDEFLSEEAHNYQQVWQGHFSNESPGHLLTTFANGSGLNIIQLNDEEFENSFDSFRGKGNAVVSNKIKGEYNFTTLLYPFAHFEERAILCDKVELPSASSWQINKRILNNDSLDISAQHIISNDSIYIIFNSSHFSVPKHNITAQTKGDFILESTGNELKIISLNNGPSTIEFKNEVRVRIQNKFISTKQLECIAGISYNIYFDN